MNFSSTLILSACLLSTSLNAFAANSTHNHQGHSHHQASQTQVKTVHGIQVALDFNTIAQHQKMMKKMKMKMSHNKKQTHFLTVTLSDKVSKKVIKEAWIKVKVWDSKKKVISAHSGEKMTPMSGMGMHHFGWGFQKVLAGPYQALLLFKVKGKTHKVNFTLK